MLVQILLSRKITTDLVVNNFTLELKIRPEYGQTSSAGTLFTSLSMTMKIHMY